MSTMLEKMATENWLAARRMSTGDLVMTIIEYKIACHESNEHSDSYASDLHGGSFDRLLAEACVKELNCRIPVPG